MTKLSPAALPEFPAQYITGRQEFWGLDLIVSPAVLIPRPETEHAVEATLAMAKSFLERRAFPLVPRIIDIGTGSGAIALALANELPTAEIHATDISTQALEVARANAARLQLASRIDVHHADLLAGFRARFFRYRRLQSSLRWRLRRRFRPARSPQIRAAARRLRRTHRPGSHWTPHPAGARTLRPGGWLVFEISGTIADRVRRLLSGWDEVEIRNDLQGMARVALARKSTGG